MFSTFAADPSEKSPQRPRQKRIQVARACDSCRLNRIKCHESHLSGGQHSNSKRSEDSSLLAANREIQQLRLELHRLQDQSTSSSSDERRSKQYPSPPDSNAFASISTSQLSTQTPPTADTSITCPQTWNGIKVPDISTGNLIHYGPLSSPFFGTRLGQYLAEKTTKLHVDQAILSPRDIRRLSHIPNILALHSQPGLRQCSITPRRDVEELSRVQEEHFLDLHWQSVHCLYPIIGEMEFREHYESLWDGFNFPSSRDSSALVDSILAICMQYGSTFLTSDEEGQGNDGVDHVTTASQNSFAVYRRAQMLLLDEMENPSIMTLQSQVYCIIYLFNMASFNAAYTMLGNASRVAHMIGLHSGSASSSAATAEQQLRSRIWSVICMLDGQLSMIPGRKSILYGNKTAFVSPGHSQEHASLSGSMLMSPNHDDITWLSFHAYSAELINMVYHIQDSFSCQVIEVQKKRAIKSFYDSPVALEELAGFLGREVRPVYEWAQTVPQSLKIPRKGTGEPFSTERTPLQFDSFSPIWLQRQRLLLEILYHHLQLSNFRSFLRLPPGSSFITPLSDCHSINCLNHAIALTNIIHQVLTDTDLLRGWSPAIQFQWDSALCILGFTLTNPICPPSPVARKCLQTAISSFEIMGKYFAASKEAALLLRKHASQAEILVQDFHHNLSGRRLTARDTTSSSSAQPVAPTVRSATTAAVQFLAAPALTPEYIQMSSRGGFNFDVSDTIKVNAPFSIDHDGLSSVPNGMDVTSTAWESDISGDLMADIDYSWVMSGGTKN